MVRTPDSELTLTNFAALPGRVGRAPSLGSPHGLDQEAAYCSPHYGHVAVIVGLRLGARTRAGLDAPRANPYSRGGMARCARNPLMPRVAA
jgi:hypothetical protein